MHHYRFEPEAEEELYSAAAWYEAEREGLGSAFLARAQEAAAFARRFPDAGSPALPSHPALGLRQVRLRRFPYRLVYMLVDKEIVIIAVAHQHRRPAYWTDRLPPGSP